MVTFVKRFGVLRRIPLLFRRKSYRDGGKTEIKSMRYLGAEPRSILKVIKRILNSMRRRIPVTLLKERRNVTVFRCAEDQSRTGIHDTLEFLHVKVGNSIEETVAIV